MQITGDGKNAPLSAEEFSSLLGPLINGKVQNKIAVAVSGGPDSMALAHCAKRWADINGVKTYAFIVDHRLREESAEEAAQTKQRLSNMGIVAEILVWKHDDVKSRIHVIARQARYDLLIGACKENSINALLLAHQRDDQAETILMRLAKGSGPEGLAGIDPVSVRDGINLLRPLLSVSKSRLISTCVAAGIEYATDPSNVSEKYARGRLRKILPLLEQEGMTVDRLIDLGQREREAKEALDHGKRMLLRAAAWMDNAGTISLNLEQLRSAPTALAARAFSHCLEAINRSAYPPERASLMPVLHSLLSDEPMPVCTLSGCMIGKTASSATIIREFSHITGVLPISPGQTVLWDGRWQVTIRKEYSGHDLTVKPLGTQPHEAIDSLSPALRHDVPQGRVRANLPAIWSGERLAIIPDIFALSGPAYAVCENRL